MLEILEFEVVELFPEDVLGSGDDLQQPGHVRHCRLLDCCPSLRGSVQTLEGRVRQIPQHLQPLLQHDLQCAGPHRLGQTCQCLPRLPSHVVRGPILSLHIYLLAVRR